MSLKKNTIWNLTGSVVPAIVGFFAIPYLIHHLGIESFGVLTLIWTLIGYFSVFDVGVGRALTQKIAQNALYESATLPDFVKTGLLLALGAGLLGSSILAILAYPLGTDWLNVAANLQRDAMLSILVAAIGIPLMTLTAGMKGVLEGFQDFKSANLLRIFFGILSFVLPVLTVMLGVVSLPWVVFSLIISRLIILIGYVYFIHRYHVIHWIKAQFHWVMGKELLSFGAWMTLSNMIGPIMVVADRFIISFALGAAWVAYYTVPADLLFYVLFIPSALSVALFPKFAFMSQNDVVAMRSMYMRSVKVVAAVMLVFSVFVMCFAYPGLVWWLGKSFAEKSYQIVMILALGLFFNGIAQIPFAIVQASGGVKKIAKMHCVECVFYVPVLFILLKSWGVLGAAVAWSIRVTCDFVVLLIYANQALHETKIRLNSREN